MYPARLLRGSKRPKLAVVTAAGLLAAWVVVLVLVAKPSEATFPGVNGRIAFESERTTGEGVDNPTGDAEIFTVNPDGTGLHQVTHNTTGDHQPAYSPDGKRIAYTGLDESGGDTEIFTIPAQGGVPTQVTDDAIVNDDPAYSPDGRRIAYSAADEPPSNTHDIFTIAAEGGTPTNVTSMEYVEPCFNYEEVDCDPYGDIPQAMEPSWSPDGTRIAYAGTPDAVDTSGLLDLYTIPATGGTPTLMAGSHSGVRFPDWSPDGTKIAYHDYPGGGIYTVSASGGTRTVVYDLDIGINPSFSPDGTRIAFDGYYGDIPGMYTMPTEGGTPISVTADGSNPSWGPTPASDCTLTGTEGSEVLEGTAGADTICALGGNDTISGLGANDTIRGGDGNDTLLGGAGDDALDGGPGTDTASFRDSAVGVKASLTTNTATGEGSDTLTAIENLYGSADYDELVGSPENNLLEGKGGGDRLNGRSGSDAFWGGSGSDKFWGGSGDDRIVGDEGADVLLGESGDDRLNSRDFKVRNDTLDGGEGTDSCATDAKELSVVNCER